MLKFHNLFTRKSNFVKSTIANYCIIADHVNNVSKTKIASFHVTHTIDGSSKKIPSQLVVYSASLDSAVSTNALILPVHNPNNDETKIIPLDLSKLPDFFMDLEKLYDRWFPKSRSINPAKCLTTNQNLIDVHRVGDYKFSIMSSKADFDRLDKSQLNVTPGAKIAIDMHSMDYSFIVYQFFQQGQIDVTPFGYLCEPIHPYAMIVPTIHGHPDNEDNEDTVSFEHQAYFDHDIYCLLNCVGTPDMSNRDVDDTNKLLNNITTDYLNRKIKISTHPNFAPTKFNINCIRRNRNMLITRNGCTSFYDLTIDTAH